MICEIKLCPGNTKPHTLHSSLAALYRCLRSADVCAPHFGCKGTAGSPRRTHGRSLCAAASPLPRGTEERGCAMMPCDPHNTALYWLSIAQVLRYVYIFFRWNTICCGKAARLARAARRHRVFSPECEVFRSAALSFPGKFAIIISDYKSVNARRAAMRRAFHIPA